MTKEIDLSIMTNRKEILPQNRDQLETDIKDIFIWAIGQNAITEMTKTVREREPSSLPLYKLYTLSRLHFTPERNVHHSRADFFDLKREDGETAADVWKRILDVEKNCEFETITAAELLASKFLSLIGKSTGDYDSKKIIRKSDMSVEAITDAIHEYIPDVTKLKTKFKKLFNENHTVYRLEVNIQLKKDAKLIQQKGRPIPIHLQQSVEKEIEKLIKQGHIEKANNTRRELLCEPSSYYGKERQVRKNCIRLKKFQRNNRETKSANAKHGGLNLKNIEKNSR